MTATYPVNSDYCAHCNTIGDHRTEQCPGSVPLPVGAQALDTEWQDCRCRPYRIIGGADRRVTDHRLTVTTGAVQWADGTVDDGTDNEAPEITVYGLDERPLNSDQARELAAALLEAAAEVDGWVTR